MKIAVISDIHGNMEALNAVLEDIKKQDINKILICGDLAMAGPEPVKTLDFIMEYAQNNDVEIIQGNTDEMLVKATGEADDKYTPPNKIMAESLFYAQKLLKPEHIEFLKVLPAQKTVKAGVSSILMVHGSPRKNNEDILPGMDEQALREIIKGVEEDIIVCGHTHLPAVYRIDDKAVINVGSVGRPFTEDQKACYAVIKYKNKRYKDFRVDLKRVEYDVESASSKLAEQSFEGADKLAQMLKKATSRYPEVV